MKRKLPILYFLMVCCAVLFALPAEAGWIYDNGPANGTIGSHDIKPQQTATVFDNIWWNDSSTVEGLIFAVWLNPGDVLHSVQMDIWVDPTDPQPYFTGTLMPKQTDCAPNKQGFDVCTESGILYNGPKLYQGTFWVELSNAQSQNNGWIGWDVNNGMGCTTTLYCPSQAVDAFGNMIFSHSFTIFGGEGLSPTPEPGSLLLLGTGAVGIMGAVRRKMVR